MDEILKRVIIGFVCCALGMVAGFIAGDQGIRELHQECTEMYTEAMIKCGGKP